MSRRTVLAASTAVIVCALVAPASAGNKPKTYAGDADAGASIALDVSLKNDKPKKIVRIRAVDLLLHCDKSGDVPNGHVNLPMSIKVSEKGKFSYNFHDTTYGLESSLAGKFKGKKVTGSFVYSAHFPAEDQYPEENCHTDKLSFSAKRGAPDRTGDA